MLASKATGSAGAGAANAGEVMLPKIAGAKVLRQPQDGAGAAQTLSKTDEVLALGEERDGYLKVTAPNGDGWIKAILLRKP